MFMYNDTFISENTPVYNDPYTIYYNNSNNGHYIIYRVNRINEDIYITKRIDRDSYLKYYSIPYLTSHSRYDLSDNNNYYSNYYNNIENNTNNSVPYLTSHSRYDLSNNSNYYTNNYNNIENNTNNSVPITNTNSISNLSDNDNSVPKTKSKGKECSVCFEVYFTRYCFDPCGHSNICFDCMTKLKQCPVCRADVIKPIRIFK